MAKRSGGSSQRNAIEKTLIDAQKVLTQYVESGGEQVKETMNSLLRIFSNKGLSRGSANKPGSRGGGRKKSASGAAGRGGAEKKRSSAKRAAAVKRNPSRRGGGGRKSSR